MEETEHLDFSHPVFSEALSRVVAEDMPLKLKLEKLFYFTRDSLPFAAAPSLKASEALKKGKALCYTKAMIYVSFCRRLGIPARLARIKFVIKADSKLRPLEHGISRIYFNGKWLYMDTVSNRDAWTSWKIPPITPFEAPPFSMENNVVVGEKYISDVAFEDYETNDVPETWLQSMRKFLDTGKW